MKDFVYVSKKERKQAKNNVIELIHLVQDEVREQFTFRYDFIGSDPRNMVTKDLNSNVGYDFDVNLRVNDDEEDYSASEIKHILMEGFNKYNNLFDYDYCEDSKRVITIKIKDRTNAKIMHSVDFAIVSDCDDGRQQYIRFNKKDNLYTWEYQPKGFYELDERISWCKDNNLWQEVRDLYIELKNTNDNPFKKSRSLFAETINNICSYYGYFEDNNEENY